jgi:hypothetical protein
MEQSPSGKLLVPQPFKEIHRNLRNPKVHYRIHKSPQLVPIPRETIIAHDSLPSCSLKIHFNISHPCLNLGSDLFPSGFPTKTLYAPLLSPIRATYPPIALHRYNNNNNNNNNPNNNPDIIIRDNKKRTCMLIDVVISGDRNLIKKEAEKILKYKDLTI